MNILAIDSAFETCSVALRLAGDTRERFEHAPRAHGALLLPWVHELLHEAGLGLGALDAIAFSHGPGSFTSLRIGIGVVQGLAFGADLPVVPVSSLKVLAQGAAGEGVEQACVVMDARMNEVYYGRYCLAGAIMELQAPEQVCAPEIVLEDGYEGWAGVGNGTDRFECLAEARWDRALPELWPRASTLSMLAEMSLKTKPGLAAELAQPVYLRDKVAEKPKS